jgi:hypothetical protein
MKLNFSGRIAIVTGGRVKIGYYIATKLLSYGCKVLTTSRFPKDTLLKYKNDPDYEKWKNNLIIYPIDFRIFESTVKFINFIKDNFPHIDIIINNAAQTVRRTAAYYKYLLPIETKELDSEDEKKIVKTDFINLQRLDLYNMQLNNINILKKCNFPNLTDLELFGNKINDINILAECNFPKLYILGLSCNLIENINSLSKCNFPLLYFLDLSNNIISDLNIFEKCNFPDIKIIKLSNNNIKSIEVFQRAKFKLLTFLELINNPIDKMNLTNRQIIEKLKKMKNVNGFDIRL